MCGWMGEYLTLMSEGRMGDGEQGGTGGWVSIEGGTGEGSEGWIGGWVNISS